jgi:DHA1 family multidrug resistance protein-like MFS transporter
MPIGLLIFVRPQSIPLTWADKQGWTAHFETHWMGPCVGEYFIAIGLMLAFNSIQNLWVDCGFMGH